MPSSPVVLVAVAVRIVEHLAVTSVQSNVGSGTRRTVASATSENDAPVSALFAVRAVGELTFGNTRADSQQQLDLVPLIRSISDQARPGQLTSRNDSRLGSARRQDRAEPST